MRFRFLFFTFFISLFISKAQTAVKYSSRISPDSLSSYLNILASDSLEGRETGKAGQKKAAAFLKGKYESWSLNPYGDFGADTTQRSFFQHHPISVKANKTRNLFIGTDQFLYGKNFFYADSSQRNTIQSHHAVLIYLHDTEFKTLSFFTDKLYSGKILVVLTDSLKRHLFTSDILQQIANETKPEALFLLSTSDLIADSLSKFSSQHFNESTPVVLIDSVVLNSIVSDERKGFLTRAGKKRKLSSHDVDVKISLLTGAVDSITGENVIAFIAGSDINSQTLVISSHYDHLGKTDSTIFHGADDNGSGTSAVLEIARIFSLAKKEGYGPARNILFLNVSGEEKGLLGSSWYVTHPEVELKSTIADLNIDMIGRTDILHDSIGVKDYVYIIGSDKISKDLHNINEAQNQMGPSLALDYTYNQDGDPNRFYSRSDHYNFAKNGIPIIFYFDGIHKDYHKVTDTSDKIDFSLLAKRTNLIFLTAWELANRRDRIRIDNDK